MLSDCINELLSKYGCDITLSANGAQYTFKGMLQPVTDKNKQSLEDSFTSIGMLDKSHIIYYGPNANGGEHLSEGCVITASGGRYLVKRCERYRCGGEVVYVWAVLRRAYDGANGGNAEE